MTDRQKCAFVYLTGASCAYSKQEHYNVFCAQALSHAFVPTPDTPPKSQTRGYFELIHPPDTPTDRTGDDDDERAARDAAFEKAYGPTFNNRAAASLRLSFRGGWVACADYERTKGKRAVLAAALRKIHEVSGEFGSGDSIADLERVHEIADALLARHEKEGKDK